MARTALVTGGNRGIGQQVARVLAGDGWNVLVGARDRHKGDEAAARLRNHTGGRLKAVELDQRGRVEVEPLQRASRGEWPGKDRVAPGRGRGRNRAAAPQRNDSDHDKPTQPRDPNAVSAARLVANATKERR